MKGSGLRVNFHKSSIILINEEKDTLSSLVEEMKCQIGDMSFTYLGLLVGTTRSKVHDCSTLIDRVERWLSASSSFLSYGGHLQLINSVFSSLLTYYMCSLLILVTIVKEIDKIWRHYPWKGNNKESCKQSLAWWTMIEGGLGVIDLKVRIRVYSSSIWTSLITMTRIPGLTWFISDTITMLYHI